VNPAILGVGIAYITVFLKPASAGFSLAIVATSFFVSLNLCRRGIAGIGCPPSLPQQSPSIKYNYKLNCAEILHSQSFGDVLIYFFLDAV
jgi:hypothetical protein